MKQTNSAIKFLMAQYRAIYKSAFSKGLSSGIALTAFLAASAANAAANDVNLDSADEWNSALKADNAVVEITGKDTDKGANGKFQKVSFVASTAGNTNLTLKEGQKFVVSDSTSSTADNKISATAANANLSITGKGSIEIAASNKEAATGHGLTVNAESGSVAIDVRNIDVQADLVLKTTGTDTGSTVSVAADNITIGDGKFIEGKNKELFDRAIVTVGDKAASGSVAFGRTNSTITVNKDGKVSVAGISGSSADVGSALNAHKLDVNGGVISFEAAATNGKAFYNVAESNYNGGIFSVKEDAALKLDVSSINFNKGSTVALGDNLELSSGTINLSDDTVLASTGSKGKITLSASANNSPDDTATLTLSSTNLQSYLSGLKADGKTKLQYTDESVLFNNVDASKALKDASTGTILMYEGATIDLTDDAADISNDKIFKFGTANAPSGSIVVSGGTIRGKNLTVSKALSNASKLEVAAEKLTVGSAEFDGSTALGVGNFYANNITLVANKGKSEFALKDELYLENTGKGTITGSINVDGGQIKVIGGDFSFGKGDNLTITSGSGSTGLVINESSVSLNGKLTTTATNGKIAIVDGIFDTSNVTEYKVAANTIELEEASNLILNGSKVVDLSDKTKVTFDAAKFDAKAVSGGDLATITMANIGSMTMDQFKSMQTQTSFNGLFNGFNISDAKASSSMTLDQVQHGTPDNVYHNTQVTVSGAIEKTYSMGSVLLSGTKTLEIGKTGTGTLLKLTNAAANGNTTNRFIQTTDGKIGGVKLSGASSALVLEGNGSIGAVTVANSGDGALIVGSIDGKVKSNVVVKGNIANNNHEGIGTLQVSDNSSLLVKGADVRAKEIFVQSGASFVAEKALVSINGTSNSPAYSEILGSEFKAKELHYSGSGDHVIANNALVEVGTFTGSRNAKIRIGSDEKDGLGATVIAGTLNLNGATLLVDPDYGREASYHISEKLLSPTNEINGNIIVGKNAVTAIGFKDKASVNEVIGDYLDDNHSFKANGSVKNALVLNKNIVVDAGSTITIDPEASNPGSAGISFGKDSALVLTKQAVTGATSAIKLDYNNKKTVDASQGGDIILADGFKEGDSFTVFEGATKIDGKLKVRSTNYFLEGDIDAQGKITNLKLETDRMMSQLSGISTPVRDLFVKIMKPDADKYFSGAGAGAEFIKKLSNSTENGVEADAAAHAATYAGAQQAAVAAVSSMSEAISGRAGVSGVEAAVLAATGSTGNGGVWITPMYKSVDSDGFDAQGASYGADVDLAGVTFGADTVRGNMRFGAAFNIGSGDADGKGNGNGLKDEFDYYGFGMYTAMAFGDCSVVADASINVVSHDVKGYSGIADFGDLSASADTTAVTMGVTGQYTIATSMVDVVPHLGMRFTRLDTDSYELKSLKGVLANTDYDVQNVFSIPLGVTLSKVFEHDGWAYAPQADISLTFNTGDVEVDSNTKFTGVTENLALNSEVMDKVTYGLNLGFAAQTGNFGTSVSVGYTGSSNTDSVGVNANARYMF